MKNIINKSILILFLLLNITACTGFLDPLPFDKFSNKVTWENEKNATLYVNGFYTYISTYGNFGGGQFGASLLTDGLTDQLKYASNVAGQGTPNLYAYFPSTISPDQNSLGVWAEAYNRVRRVNEAIEGLRAFANFGAETKNDFEAQLRFFRSYIYFQLIKRHRSVILLDKPTSEKSLPRASEDAGWDFIEQDLDYAIQHLPVERPLHDRGRLTRGMALAFKSRLMLYAKRWNKAQEAAQACIALTNSTGALIYELNPNYAKAFMDSIQNKEAIIYFRYAIPAPIHTFDKNYVPGGDYSGLGALAGPTQEMVESYELATGGFADWSKWHAITTETPPYELLEPRFKASVLYNGANWKGRKIESYVGGIDGYQSYGGSNSASNGHSVTGYFLRKNLNENNKEVDKNSSTQPWIELRLAEVYLNLAEAAAELKDDATATEALNKVRARVSLPPVAKNGTELMDAIRHERKVELAFEGQYYWDLRRWGLAMTYLNDVRFHGLKITKSGDELTYTYVEVDDRDRKYLERLQKSFPIPSSEIANNLGLEQLDEWK